MREVPASDSSRPFATSTLPSRQPEAHAPHQLPQSSVDELQGFLLQAMQQQQQQQAIQAASAQQQQAAELQQQQQQAAQELHQQPAQQRQQEPPQGACAQEQQQQQQQQAAADLAALLHSQLYPNQPGLVSPLAQSRPSANPPWPMSPLGTLGLDALMWAPTSPTTLMAAELASGAWDDGRLETPLRQHRLSDFMFSPSPHHRQAAASQVLPTVGTNTDMPVGNASLLLNGMAAWHNQQHQVLGASQLESINALLDAFPPPAGANAPSKVEGNQLLAPTQPGGSTTGYAAQAPAGGSGQSLASAPASVPSLASVHNSLLSGLSGSAAQALLQGMMASSNLRTSQASTVTNGTTALPLAGASTSVPMCIVKEEKMSPAEQAVDVPPAAQQRPQRRRVTQPAASDSETSLDVSAPGIAAVPALRSRGSYKSEARYEGSGRAALETEEVLRRATPALTLATQSIDHRSCHCKKSQCLKLYCDCFAAGVYCVNCSCNECFNRPEHVHKVAEKREQIIQRDPKAFSRKIQSDDQQQQRHKKGCNCKRSHCLKKYCECFQGGVRCSDACKCLECHNQEERGGSRDPSAYAPALTSNSRGSQPEATPFRPIPSRLRGGQAPSTSDKAMAAGSDSGGGRRLRTRAARANRDSSGQAESGEAGGDASEGEGAGRQTLAWLQALQSPWSTPGPGGNTGSGGDASPRSQHLAQVLDGCGLQALDGAVGMTTPPGVRSISQSKGQVSGPYLGAEDAARRNTPSTLRYPHSHVVAGGAGAQQASGGSLRRYDAEAAAALVGQELSLSHNVAVKMEQATSDERVLGVSDTPCLRPLEPQGSGAGEDKRGMGAGSMDDGDRLMAASEDLQDDDDDNHNGGPGAAGGGPWMRRAALDPTQDALPASLLSPMSASLAGRFTPTAGGAFDLGSPAGLALGCLFSAAGLDGGMFSPWHQELLSLGSPVSGGLSSPLGGGEEGSPFEPGGVHALVSPVRTGRRTVGVKRNFGTAGAVSTGPLKRGDGGAPERYEGAGGIPTSPALDALACVAAAERRSGGGLLGGGVGGAPREGVLLLPQSPSKRSALGTGPLPLRPTAHAASRNPSLPPLSSRQQQMGDAIAGHPTDPIRTRTQQGSSGPANSQSSVGSPAAGGNAGGNPGSMSLDALKAQANDYIASRCRGLASQASLNLPPLSLPPLSGGALARSHSVPVPPPSHPIPGLSCRPSSHTSSATTTVPPPGMYAATATTTNLPSMSSGPVATAAAAPGSNSGQGAAPGGTGSNTSGPHANTDAAAGGGTSGADGASGLGPGTLPGSGFGLDVCQALGPASMAMLCSTPWGDAGETSCLDSLMMSPLAGWDPSMLLMSPRVTTPLYTKGGTGLNSPFFAMSPSRWWPSSAMAGAAGAGAGASGLAPLHPGLLGGPAPPSGTGSVMSPGRGGGDIHSLLAASQLLRMTPGTTVLSSSPPPLQQQQRVHPQQQVVPGLLGLGTSVAARPPPDPRCAPMPPTVALRCSPAASRQPGVRMTCTQACFPARSHYDAGYGSGTQRDIRCPDQAGDP